MIRTSLPVSAFAKVLCAAALGAAVVLSGVDVASAADPAPAKAPAAKPAAAAAAAPAKAAASGDAAAGKTVFLANCVSCHGESGKGDGPVGAALNPKPRDFTKADFKLDTDKDGKAGTDADLKNVLKNGAAAYGGSPLMAPWGGVLSDKDIDNVIAYVRSFHK